MRLTVRTTPAGVNGRGPLRLDWSATSSTAERQVGYEIEAAPTPEFAAGVQGTGPVAGAGQLDVVAPGGPLRSREVRYLRVRVATDAGWSDWSEPATVEAGLLAPADWQAGAVTLPDDPGARQQSPAPLLRKVFELPGGAPPGPAARHLSRRARGRVNGVRVGDHLLDPGWTAYRQRLLVTSHDVTDLLAAGANVLAGRLGDGWYRGRLGLDPQDDRCRYGRQLGLLAQLEIELPDGSTVTVGTDESWRASTGEVGSADLYDGCRSTCGTAGGLGPARVRRLRVGAGRGRPARPGDPAAAGGAAGPAWCDLPAERSVAPGGASASTPVRTSLGVVRLTHPRPAPATP